MAASGQPDPGHDALPGDPTGPLGDRHRLGQPVQPVDGEHHVGGLGRGGGASRPHRHADVGRGQRRGVVDAVADHYRDRAAALDADGLHLLRRACARPAPCRRRARRRRSRPRRRRSPVTMTTRSMPHAEVADRPRRRPARTGSSSRIAPAGSPSTATNTVSAPSSSARARIGWPIGRPSRRDPAGRADRDRPAADPTTTPAVPGTSSTASRDREREPPLRGQPATMAAASTWGDTWSSDAASRRSSSAAVRRPATTSATTWVGRR